MINNIIIVFLLSCSLSLFSTDYNHIGSLQEIIDAAQNEEEPEYLTTIHCILYRKLAEKYKEFEIKNKREKYAWLVVNAAISDISFNKAYDAILDKYKRDVRSASIPKWRILREKTNRAIQRTLEYRGWDACRETLKDFGTQIKANSKKTLFDPLISSMIKTTDDKLLWLAHWRLAEYEALNLILKELDTIFKTSYEAALGEIPNDLDIDSFNDIQQWKKLEKYYLISSISTNAEEVKYLLPQILHVVPLTWIDEKLIDRKLINAIYPYQAMLLLLGNQDEKSDFYQLPLDLINVIFGLF